MSAAPPSRTTPNNRGVVYRSLALPIAPPPHTLELGAERTNTKTHAPHLGEPVATGKGEVVWGAAAETSAAAAVAATDSSCVVPPAPLCNIVWDSAFAVRTSQDVSLDRVVADVTASLAQAEVEAVHLPETWRWKCTAYASPVAACTRFDVRMYSSPGVAGLYLVELGRMSGDGYFFHATYSRVREAMRARGHTLQCRGGSSAPPKQQAAARPSAFVTPALPVSVASSVPPCSHADVQHDCRVLMTNCQCSVLEVQLDSMQCLASYLCQAESTWRDALAGMPDMCCEVLSGVVCRARNLDVVRLACVCMDTLARCDAGIRARLQSDSPLQGVLGGVVQSKDAPRECQARARDLLGAMSL